MKNILLITIYTSCFATNSAATTTTLCGHFNIGHKLRTMRSRNAV